MEGKKILKLNDVIKNIHNTVDLETTCNRNLCCCKTACPQMNYSEFLNLISYIWDNFSHNEKIDLICKSIEYFFKFEFSKWGMDTLIKPCMLLDEENKVCKCYNQRPLNCRIYGLWPNDMYEERVLKFSKIYEDLGVKREELPLNRQCPLVKRKNTDEALKREDIESMYKQLDDLDRKLGDFTDEEISDKENVRTFHDWLLFKVFGEKWLNSLTVFMSLADKEILLEQIEICQEMAKEAFSKSIPNIQEGINE